MNRTLLILLGLSLPLPLLSAWTAAADPALVFRCTAADGTLSVRDVPCPPGSAQIIQRRGASAASTATTALGQAATAPALDRAPQPEWQVAPPADDGHQVLDSDTLRAPRQAPADGAPPKPPLPAMFRCVAGDGSPYLHERDPAPPHCVPLIISGLGGSQAPGNAASCEVTRDACEALLEAARCGAWQQRFRDARGRERFTAPQERAEATAERERLQAVLDASDCPVPWP